MMTSHFAGAVPEESNAAILCRDVCFSCDKKQILTNINLTVPRGQIYALLGRNASGKTTLLKCIMGKLKISQGQISVLGKPPGSPGYEVPGRMVGYKPQDLALYNYCTISDTFWFYGCTYGLSPKDTRERMEFFTNLLNLPPEYRLIRNLSGHERRRISLVMALLHNPPLVILEEPEVDVGQRRTVWKYLLDIVKDGQVSVILTTHYVEEARKANMVGIMKDGKLVAEAKPDEILQKHNAATMEEVFEQLYED